LHGSCIVFIGIQWRIQGFSKGGGSILKVGFQRGGSTIILGFQRGFPCLSKCVIFTLFCQNFLTKGGGGGGGGTPPPPPPPPPPPGGGGVPTPGTPPPSGSANGYNNELFLSTRSVAGRNKQPLGRVTSLRQYGQILEE
jgi:hypothetical protein